MQEAKLKHGKILPGNLENHADQASIYKSMTTEAKGGKKKWCIYELNQLENI